MFQGRDLRLPNGIHAWTRKFSKRVFGFSALTDARNSVLTATNKKAGDLSAPALLFLFE